MADEWRERIEDLDDPMITVIDSENQALMIRVGPVWVEGERLDELVVWIEYQNVHQTSEHEGPVLISAEGWRKLNHEIETRLNNGQH